MTALFHSYLFNFNRISKETMVISFPVPITIMVNCFFFVLFLLRSATKALSLNVGHKTSLTWYIEN